MALSELSNPVQSLALLIEQLSKMIEPFGKFIVSRVKWALRHKEKAMIARQRLNVHVDTPCVTIGVWLSAVQILGVNALLWQWTNL